MGSRVRDRSIGLAARIVVDTIDHLAPGLGDEDDDQAAIRPQLQDRITAVLLMTPRGDAGEHGPASPHGERPRLRRPVRPVHRRHRSPHQRAAARLHRHRPATRAADVPPAVPDLTPMTDLHHRHPEHQ
ncbi:hypothetical protein E4K10_30210 [Streptomyces sp. T1317-0309]|nr:hypothetical protein E4K10_30210 [Streptomyces sp. T1317-0309]